jgi:hypothetical protein
VRRHVQWQVQVMVLIASIAASACGGSGNKNSTPTSPTTPTTPTQANRSPVINSLSVNPTFGIAQLTAFSFSGTASDPDGDQISYQWDIAGNAASSSNATITFSVGGNGLARLTVSDGKGGSASDSRTFIVGTMAGTWRGLLGGVAITVTLTQPAGGLITGSWSQSIGSGILDPATVNKIDAGGNVTMRFKVSQGSFNDFTITGTLDQTGARFVGVANGSGFSGTPIVLTK